MIQKMIITCDYNSYSHLVSEVSTNKIIIRSRVKTQNVIDIVIENCSARALLIHDKKNKYSITIRRSKFHIIQLRGLVDIEMDNWNARFERVLLSGDISLNLDDKFKNTRVLLFRAGTEISGTLESSRLQILKYNNTKDLILVCPDLRTLKKLKKPRHSSIKIHPCCRILLDPYKCFLSKYLIDGIQYPNITKLIYTKMGGTLDLDLYPALSKLQISYKIDSIKNPRRLEKITFKNLFKYTRDVLEILPECDTLVFKVSNIIYHFNNTLLNRLFIEEFKLDTYDKAGTIKIELPITREGVGVLYIEKYTPVCENFFIDCKDRKNYINLYYKAVKDDLPLRRLKIPKSARKIV